MSNENEHSPEQPQNHHAAPAPKKKGWLSKSFAFAASAATGAAIGIAAKSCATALLCTAGAPATVTAITAMACAGLAIGAVKSYRDYAKDKKSDNTTTFWNKSTAKNMGISTALSMAFGGIILFGGDQIAEQAGSLWDKIANVFSGQETAAPDVTSEPPASSSTDNNADHNNEPLPLPPSLVENVAPAEAQTQAAPPETTSPEESSEPVESPSEPSAAEESLPPEDESPPEVPSVEPPAEPAVEQEETPPVSVTPAAAAATLSLEPSMPDPVIYTVECGDNLWNIVKDHYGLTSNADIQRFVDAVAVENGLTEGAEANCIYEGDQITLPDASAIEGHDTLMLNWEALDAATKMAAQFSAEQAQSAYDAAPGAQDPAFDLGSFIQTADCQVNATGDQGGFDFGCTFEDYHGPGNAFASVSMPGGEMPLNVPVSDATDMRSALVNDVLPEVSIEMQRYVPTGPR